MISVILPTYNGSKYIGESIESIINQSYKDWELIIINDCSTDETETVVKKYLKDDRIKYYKNEKNLKLPASLNRGFSLSCGQYLTWTSDDNLYKKNAFEVMLSTISQYNDVGLVFADYDIIDDKGRYLDVFRIPDNLDILYWNNIIGAAFLYKRSVYEKIGEYDVSKFLVEDYDYWLRIAHEYKIMPIRQSLYSYRTHSANLTNTRSKEIQARKVKLLTNMLENWHLSEHICDNIYITLAEIAYDVNDIDSMRIYLSKMTGHNVRIPRRLKRADFLGSFLTKIYKKIRI